MQDRRPLRTVLAVLLPFALALWCLCALVGPTVQDALFAAAKVTVLP